MVSQSVEQAVGVGGDPGRCQGYQRTQRGRRAFKRQLVKQTAVHVGVSSRIVFDQIFAALHCDGI